MGRKCKYENGPMPSIGLRVPIHFIEWAEKHKMSLSDFLQFAGDEYILARARKKQAEQGKNTACFPRTTRDF